jgi:hypothetical protein
MYREAVIKLVSEEHHEKVRSALGHSGRALQLWLVGKLIAMANCRCSNHSRPAAAWHPFRRRAWLHRRVF